MALLAWSIVLGAAVLAWWLERGRRRSAESRLEWQMPVKVGDPERDPICLEISFCGPNSIAVYCLRPSRLVRQAGIEPNGKTGLFVWNGDAGRCALVTRGRRESESSRQESWGFAEASQVGVITDKVRRYNRRAHAVRASDRSFSGKESTNAGAVTEAE